MNIPTPRYAIGDTVFYTYQDTKAGAYPCPDCKGSKVWSCTSPAGHTMEMDCPRCTYNYGRNQGLSLARTIRTYGVRVLTIGSVQINTARTDGPVHYMCLETGVGSGSVYRECDLYSTKDEAETKAAAQAEALQLEHDATPQAIESRAKATATYFRAYEHTVESTVKARLQQEVIDGSHQGITAGNWVVEEEGDGRYAIKAITPEYEYGVRIAEVSGDDAYSHLPPASDAFGNAHLVAAAPVLYGAIAAVIKATRDYLPPDGISKDEFIKRVIAATDNPQIVAALQQIER
ncbi:hypothetical protein [Stenotrophomonas tumulicola]|uniref:Uncharacterized protein n=1 Tax=Stenotrophomonas tumulicola TaxID=1685415 RepID=A0A7W3IG14_9GAMM|nr:hypothetical protein [Stenotrophomonas tumulicola]MBA8680483.1 hypothetical protein [Stenotrophomonas tumulicola]